MTLFLLLLLAGIALCITLVGYLLTARPQTPYSRPRPASPADWYVMRGGGRPVPPSLDLGANRSRYATRMRSTASVERQSPWSDIWQLQMTGRELRRGKLAPTHWLGVTLVLISLFLLGIVLLRTILPNAVLIGAVAWPYSSPPQTNKPAPAPVFAASSGLVRLSQLDLTQYSSKSEWNTWAYSACSTASMTEVINAYGHNYRITNILKVESALGEITPQLGLLEDAGVAHTVSRFGFKTSWGHNLSLDQVLNIANHGRPVIVSFPPHLYAGGHLLVVLGGNSQSVHLADSSLLNRQVLARAQFLKWWGGYYAIVTPK
jgi:hypothetical protein